MTTITISQVVGGTGHASKSHSDDLRNDTGGHEYQKSLTRTVNNEGLGGRTGISWGDQSKVYKVLNETWFAKEVVVAGAKVRDVSVKLGNA
jgi:hypothetical protein